MMVRSRIDTLAYDNERQAFVIIEYKRSSSYSVFDQGVSLVRNLKLMDRLLYI